MSRFFLTLSCVFLLFVMFVSANQQNDETTLESTDEDVHQQAHTLIESTVNLHQSTEQLLSLAMKQAIQGELSVAHYQKIGLLHKNMNGHFAWSCCRVCPQQHYPAMDQQFGQVPRKPKAGDKDDLGDGLDDGPAEGAGGAESAGDEVEGGDDSASSAFVQLLTRIRSFTSSSLYTNSVSGGCCQVCPGEWERTNPDVRADENGVEKKTSTAHRFKTYYAPSVQHVQFSPDKPPLPPCCNFCDSNHYTEQQYDKSVGLPVPTAESPAVVFAPPAAPPAADPPAAPPADAPPADAPPAAPPADAPPADAPPADAPAPPADAPPADAPAPPADAPPADAPPADAPPAALIQVAGSMRQKIRNTQESLNAAKKGQCCYQCRK